MGVVTRVSLHCAALALVVTLSACAGNERVDEVVTSTTTTAPRISGFSACGDPTGDGSLGADLVAARLATQGQVLTVVYDTATPPTAETVLWSVMAASRYQLGLKRIGQEVVVFVFDFRTARQQNFSSSHLIDGTMAQAVYPLSAMPDLAPSFDWRATVNVEGTDTDECEGRFTAG